MSYNFLPNDPGDLIPQAHDVGSRVMLQVTTVAQAVEAAEHGVDVIIAQGTEAGGYGGTSARWRSCRRSWMPCRRSRLLLQAEFMMVGALLRR